jgi:ABC-2 type transport system permease protein
MSAATAIVGYTVRACLPARRRLGLLLLGAIAVLFGLLSRGNGTRDAVDVVEVAGTAMFTLVLPIAALVVGDAVLGAEIRNGTFGFTWMSPVRVATIVFGRWMAGTAITCAVLVPAALLAASIGGAPEVAGALALATALGAAAYIAVFLAIGATFRRATVMSLIFVFLVERLFGAVLSAIAQLSPGWLARSVFTGMVDGLPNRLIRDGIPSGGGAIVRLAIVTAATLALAVRGLRRLRITGAAD